MMPFRVGCGHPACCQMVFASKDAQLSSADNAASFGRTVVIAGLVFIVPVALFIMAVAISSATMSPLTSFILALCASVSWYFVLRVGLRRFFSVL